MGRVCATAALALVISVSVSASAGAETPHEQQALDTSAPLDESDLRNITLQVMQKHPLLASSPGIKFASAQRGMGTTDIASIVYFPHAESGGMQHAFQVRCLRSAPNEEWRCEEPEIRRYLRLDSQDFEVRVTANIGTEQALALIQAARGTVQAGHTAGAAMPATAIMILPDGNDYLVTWGSPEGQQEMMVRGHLRDGGKPAR